MNVRSRTRTAGPHVFGSSRPDLLAIYLNDHLTGATAGLERARHLQRTAQGSELGTALDPVVAEIAEDRESLLEIMRDLGVPVRRYRAGVGWAAEKAGRLKGNGRLLRRSPLSTVLELEALRLGVEGKAAGWQTLRRLAVGDTRLDARRLDDLLERARRQRDVIEEWRIRRAGQVLRQE